MIGGHYQEPKAKRGQQEEQREESKQEEPEITICTLGDIAEQEYPDNPLIPPFLDEGESWMIPGPSGIGKSLLVTQIALMSGSQQSLWGKFTVSRPLRSIFIQSENPGKAMNKRLRLMVAGNPELKEGMNNIFLPVIDGDCRMTGELTDRAFQAKAIELIKTVQADIIILDPLISYITGDENDNAAMRRSLDCLTEIQNKTSTASIVVHHLGKAAASGELNDVFSGRGASAIGDWAANILTLKKEKQENSEVTIEALHHKARNFELQPPFYLKRTPDLQFHLCERPGTKRDQHVQAAIDSLDSLSGEVSRQSELEAHIIEQANISRQTARRGIQRARELGMIYAVPGKGNATGLRLGSSGSKRD
jgi:RecA-family ATPase